jgi:CPA2 family monovalent cation:H+ antiporter-2
VEPASLLRDFAIITGAAAAALFVFRLLRLPPVLGYLVAGVVISPYTLPEISVLEFESIRSMADLGLVVLLFALGIDFGWERIRRVGLRVVFIAAVEIAFMVWLGYQIGLALGWTSTEAFFLGSALSISSSAILAKLLRDSGQLSTRRGQLIIGILVIEDFAAVILLSVLTGVAATGGATGASDIGLLAGRLALFAVAALVLGTLFVPRIVTVIERLQSAEMLLLASLGMCFGLALLAERAGLSAAAGAFLIGTVVGDSVHSQLVGRMIAPVRDLFGAIFFVSIGMLVNFSELGGAVVPAIVVISVFVAGKFLINALATFLTGEGPRAAVEVGTGMPQLGEFSLAMGKIGADKGIIAAPVNPVIVLTTVVTSFVAPFIFRSAKPLSDLADRRSPALLRQYFMGLTRALDVARAALAVQGPVAREIRQAARRVMVNVGIIALLVAVGTLLLRVSIELSGELHVARTTFGLLIGAVVMFLSVPSVVIIFRSTSDLGERVADEMIGLWPEGADRLRRTAFAHVIRLSVRATLLVSAAIWGLPFVLNLFALGSFARPVAIAVVVLLVLFTFQSARRIHRQLEVTFRKTLLGEQVPEKRQGPG